MGKSFPARIAARRVFKSPDGRPVVLTIGVPEPVPGSDWGCALQITGLDTGWRRPRYAFGIDALQALHLAMLCAGTVLESTRMKLEWLGQTEDLGMPRFLPTFPPPYRDRFQAILDREATRLWRRIERDYKTKISKRTPTKATAGKAKRHSSRKAINGSIRDARRAGR
jgi:hypothetical protein